MKKHFTLLSIFLAIFVITSVGQGCLGLGTKAPTSTSPVELVVWRVLDETSSFDKLITAYRSQRPHVTITYKKMRLETYEDELLQAFAEDRGPDILSLHNTWIQGYQTLTQPMPDTIDVTTRQEQGTIKKEVVYITDTVPTTSIRKFRNDFVDVVSDDVIFVNDGKERIHGFPLAVDTLVLFYNKDLLNAAGIPEPPGTWSEFQNQVKEMTVVDKDGNVLQAGGALGTGDNVERSFDILSLLMMQNGTLMISSRGGAVFHQTPSDYTYSDTPPGIDALRFYTDFANPTKEVYTWNNDMPNSFDSFVNGQAAFFFGYSYHIPQIRAKAPKLNFSITSAPQISGGRQANYANYWVETVSEKTEYPDEAWDFIQFIAEADQARDYLEATNKPTALRSLISEQIEDEDLSAFASQLLTAVSWYQGEDVAVTEQAFIDMIDNVVSGVNSLEKAISDAANKVNQTL